MKKQRRKPAAKSTSAPAPRADTTPNRRVFLQNARNWVIGGVVLGAGGVFATRTVMAGVAEQDLTRVGNGIPAIVQIHDPGCPICQELQREARAALQNIDNNTFQYLVANIKSDDGSAFANLYRVPHVTLMLFDGDGEVVDILRGAQNREALQSQFTTFLQIAARR